MHKEQNEPNQEAFLSALVEGLTTVTPCSELLCSADSFSFSSWVYKWRGAVSGSDVKMITNSWIYSLVLWWDVSFNVFLGGGKNVLLHERVSWIFVTKRADCSQLYYCFLIFTIIFCKGVLHPCPLPCIL